jgi:hypothetical protein
MPQMIARIPVVIANGEAVSEAANLRGGLLSTIEMPAAWTAANLTFQTCGDGSNFFDLYDELGTEVTAVADASRRIRLEPSQFAAVAQIKVRSGTTGTPVNQVTERTLYLEVWE